MSTTRTKSKHGREAPKALRATKEEEHQEHQKRIAKEEQLGASTMGTRNEQGRGAPIVSTRRIKNN